MEKKIVFINQATGYLTIDIINEFAKNYEKVDLIAGFIRVHEVELAENVVYHRTLTYNRGNPIKKFGTWLLATIHMFFLLKTKFRKHEIFYITIPPLAYLLSYFLKNKFSILIFDVYPDVLKIYNVSEKSIIYKTWQKINLKIYAKAHRIYTLGDGMAALIAQYMPKEKINIIPNWSGFSNPIPVKKQDNNWIKKHNLENKFIVQYSGNIGFTHNVELLLDVAEKLITDDDILFLIIGRGEKANFIQDLITSKKLSNCKMLPFQPDSEINESLSAADIGVVLLDDKTAHVSIPSKIYNLQSLAVPILCLAPHDSELARHVKKFNNGTSILQSDINGIINFINRMKNNPSELMVYSENSFKAAPFFTKENAKDYYEIYSN